MKKFLTIVSFFVLSAGLLMADPIQNYQNTPPFNPGGKTTALSSTDQSNICTGFCTKSSDLKSTTMDAQYHYMKTAFVDTSFSFVDTVSSFTAAQVDTIRVIRHGWEVCWRTVAGYSGTSNGTTFVLQAFPTSIRPILTLTVPTGGVMTDSTVANRNGDFQIASTGVVTFRRANLGTTATTGVMSAVFLGSGTKAIAGGAGGCYDIKP